MEPVAQETDACLKHTDMCFHPCEDDSFLLKEMCEALWIYSPAIKNVISNCILSRGIKVEQLSTFDIEYLFLNIRGKSVGENVDVLVTCPDDGQTQVEVTIYQKMYLANIVA